MPGPDILSALVAGTKAKAGDLNDKFDSIKAWGSAIPLTDLADQTPGVLLIANGSGVVTGIAPTGAMTVSSAGATTLGHFALAASGFTTLTVDNTTFTTVTGLSGVLPAGTWYITAKISAWTDNVGLVRAELLYGAAQLDEVQCDTPGPGKEAGLSLLAGPVVSDAASTLQLKATSGALTGSGHAGVGSILAVRIS